MKMELVELNENVIKINGKEEILLCASFFYFRIPRKEWEARAQLLSSLGYNCVDIYFPWNFHEKQPGIFDFTKDRDIESFLDICGRNHLYVVARPGPYICSEWDGGGLPSWIISGYEIRQNDEAYLKEVQKWYERILQILKKHQIGETENGSIILLQLENELDFFDCLDVEGYMKALKDLALECGITVPLFACAGQGDIKRSGGLTEGVFPTYNFYPSCSDKTFDYNLAQYAKYLKQRKMPFLVTETDRKHCILKRELLSGAKLLGAYNQVGGSNFGYYQSVNNWGNPLSLICTLYDFGGMIDNLGHCTKEADEALLLSELLRAYERKLAGGIYAETGNSCSFMSEDIAAANTIELAGSSGNLICVRSTSAQPLLTKGKYGDLEFELYLDSYEAVALPEHMKWNNFEIVFSNNEIFSFEPLVFIERNKPFLLLCENGKQHLITGGGEIGTVKIAFISKSEAIERIKQKRKLTIQYCRNNNPIPVTECEVGLYENKEPFIKAENPLFSCNEIWYGEAEYQIKSNGKKLFFKGVGDFLLVKNDHHVVYSGLCFCDDVITEGKGEVIAAVEKWGLSNFDDARKKSLRIKAERGIEQIYQIEKEEEISGWRFSEVEHFSENGEKFTIEKTETDPYLSINSWNSTKEPLVAGYYTQICPKPEPGEKFLLYLENPEAECHVFLNNKFLFRFSGASKSVNITEQIIPGEQNDLELCVRKPDWAKKTGRLFLLKVKPCEFKLRRVIHQHVYHSDFKPSKLPLMIEQGKTYSLRVNTMPGYDTYGYIKGTGFRATVMQEEEVIARIVAASEQIVQAGSPDHSKFLIPGNSDHALYFYIEAMKNGSFEFAVGKESDENRAD